MTILIAGASGLIGSALVPVLRGAGHDVRRLVRRPARATDEIAWEPASGKIDRRALLGVEAVINLAGENVGAGRWTARRREEIFRSRVDSTRTLVAAMAETESKPRVFLSASATGFYGDRGDERLTEAATIGKGFLPEVCLAWETHALGAARNGIRTGLLRFGPVLAAEGGALAKMLPVFRLGLGGKFGAGKQWMSWVSRDDAIGAIVHALSETRCVGPMNLVAPGAVTNADFSATLARVLRRPAWMRVPAPVLRLVLGQMADEALLASTRAVPQRLEETGYRFRHPELEAALKVILSRTP